jgi:hypothetical protein
LKPRNPFSTMKVETPCCCFAAAGSVRAYTWHQIVIVRYSHLGDISDLWLSSMSSKNIIRDPRISQGWILILVHRVRMIEAGGSADTAVSCSIYLPRLVFVSFHPLTSFRAVVTPRPSDKALLYSHTYTLKLKLCGG